MLRRLYDWMLTLAGHRHALWALAAVSFIESSIFPIPPDVLLIPMILAARHRAWTLALVCTLASVAGGAAGYGIGYFLYESLGRPLLDFYGYGEKFHEFQQLYNEWGLWIVVMAGFTPFPYKVITIASGVTALDMTTFMLASLASRGARFYLEAALLKRFGSPIQTFIETNLQWLTVLFFILLLGGFVAIKYLV